MQIAVRAVAWSALSKGLRPAYDRYVRESWHSSTY